MTVLAAALPEAVAAGLAGYPPALAARAGAAIGVAAEALGRWEGSGLTGDGFPLELGFTTADPALRWTFDPVPPGAARPVEAALAALVRLGQTPGSCVGAIARRLEAASAVSFAWIGGRHDAAGDRYKLYVPLPKGPEAEAALAALALPRPRLPDPPAVPRMLAFGPGPERVEVYWRAAAPVWMLPRLLEPAGVADRATALAATLEDAWGHRLRDRLPGGDVGISYARCVDGPPSATLFLIARTLWGGDGRIRARMLERLTAAGAPVAGYETVTRPLAGARTAETRHGMVGIGIGQSGFHWSIGVRPVAGR